MPKAKHKPPKKKRSVKVDKLQVNLERSCYVCGRAYCEMVMIGPTTYRCEDCFPGSANWFEYWLAIPYSKRPAIINEVIELYRKAQFYA